MKPTKEKVGKGVPKKTVPLCSTPLLPSGQLEAAMLSKLRFQKFLELGHRTFFPKLLQTTSLSYGTQRGKTKRIYTQAVLATGYKKTAHRSSTKILSPAPSTDRKGTETVSNLFILSDYITTLKHS